MIDSSTNEKLVVSGNGDVGQYIMVPVLQIDTVCALLDKNEVSYWVDEVSVSLDGSPEVSVINLGKPVDPKRVQSILDNAS